MTRNRSTNLDASRTGHSRWARASRVSPLLVALTLAVIACKGDRQAARGAAAAPASRGPDQIVLRIPRTGGTARAYIYPRFDSVVSSIGDAPPISRVLAFDPEDGTVAFIDDKGLPRRLDLRAAEARTASKAKLTSLSTSNGSDIYGITSTGGVSRITPTGDWSFDPPSPAKRLYPQKDGSLIIAGSGSGKTELWLIRPTDDEVIETASLPAGARNGVQVGDRIYFIVDSGLVGVRARDLKPVKGIAFDRPVRSVVPTPSGDRIYVSLDGANEIAVVDRYTETVSEKVGLPAPASELRMDPLGQNVLARPAGNEESAWVVGVGTDRVSGTIRTAWRADLPYFAPGDAIATLRGEDVVLVDASSLSDRQTINGGAADYWYFMTWNGFRPRAAELDRPVAFDSSPAPAADSPVATIPSRDTIPSPPLRDAKPSMVEPPAAIAPRSKGYLVSFAAVLTQQKANEAAAGITVGASHPRVIAAQSGNTTVYRVVLGPFATRDEADRVGRQSGRPYWVYEEGQ